MSHCELLRPADVTQNNQSSKSSPIVVQATTARCRLSLVHHSLTPLLLCCSPQTDRKLFHLCDLTTFHLLIHPQYTACSVKSGTLCFLSITFPNVGRVHYEFFSLLQCFRLLNYKIWGTLRELVYKIKDVHELRERIVVEWHKLDHSIAHHRRSCWKMAKETCVVAEGHS